MKKMIALLLVSILSTSVFAGGNEGGSAGGTRSKMSTSASREQVKM